MADITFLHPQFLWLLILLPLITMWHSWKKKQHQATLKVPSINGFRSAPSLLAKLRPLLFVLRLLALALIIVAMARPRTPDVNVRTISTEGIDIVIAMDVSISMLAQDLEPNRLEALKKIAEGFVDKRPNDRIGLVVYAAESYTAAPVTSDHAIVKQALRQVRYYANVIKDGTAIGTGLTTAVSRLKSSKAKSKVIILLTDGVNNTGLVTPAIAADIAYKYGVKVYTIGIGTKGLAIQPTGVATANRKINYHLAPVKLDEELLQDIARKTGGKFFRATDNNSLKEIYNEINTLEKSEIKDKRYLNYDEKFRPFLLLGLLFLITEFILKRTVYKSFI